MGVSRGFGLLAGIIASTATGFLVSQVGPCAERPCHPVSPGRGSAASDGRGGRHGGAVPPRVPVHEPRDGFVNGDIPISEHVLTLRPQLCPGGSEARNRGFL